MKKKKDELKKRINLKKNKKLLIILGGIILALIIFLCFFNPKAKITIFEPKVNITLSEANRIKLVDYQDENFTMKIPEGWKVKTAGTGMFYAIHVFDPKETANQIFVSLKAAPFIKSNAAKKFWEQYTVLSNNYYNSEMFANAVILDPATTENFYSNFNNYAEFAKKYETTYTGYNFPFVSVFTKIEEFESNSYIKSYALDDKTIRATFENEKGSKCEGLFMATLVSAGDYYVSQGVDTLYNMAYNVIFISSLENEFINYENILTESLSTLQYTDSFVSITKKNIETTTESALKANATIQSAFDSYNSAWTNRQKSYDISSQKYSDATLGYERVYDVETGEVYKAYNGFTDDYNGDRYQPITDDMYSNSIEGYIEK